MPPQQPDGLLDLGDYGFDFRAHGYQTTEDRGQRTEDRGQRTEDRGQETEVFSPSSDIRLPFKSQVPVCFPFFLHARFLFSVFSVSLLRKGLVGCAPLTPGTPPTDLSMVQGVPTGHEML